MNIPQRSYLERVRLSASNSLAELLVPTTVQYELYKWVKRESDENTALDTIALADDSLVVSLE